MGEPHLERQEKDREVAAENEVQQTLRRLFNQAAAMSLAVVCRLDAEPEMLRFLEFVRAHPNQRDFAARLMLGSFSESFQMRHAPIDLIMYCMSELRWPEIRTFIEGKRAEDVKAHGVACYGVWNDLLESFDENWREKYFTDLTTKPN